MPDASLSDWATLSRDAILVQPMLLNGVERAASCERRRGSTLWPAALAVYLKVTRRVKLEFLPAAQGRGRCKSLGPRNVQR